MLYIRSRVRNLYHYLPPTLRQTKIMRGLSRWGSRALIFGHQDIYTADYYRSDVEPPAAHAAPIISASIIADFTPKQVIDIGCGTGALLSVLKQHGCTCVGLEYADAGIKICKNRGLDVRKFDIENDNIDSSIGSFDIAISTEVAEHLPEQSADRFVDLLTRLSSTIVITAAPPGQGGIDHVNEQYPEYWIAKFRQCGFNLDTMLVDKWKKEWRAGGIADFFYNNLMIFRKRTNNQSS